MKHQIREPFGKAGLTVAILALVAAMAGGAYAAGGLTKSQEKQVTKIAKKYAGKPGATGPAGPAGAPGKEGAKGANGSNGSNGANGESVAGESVAITSYHGPECATASGEGGAKFTNKTGTAYACNGAASGGGGFAEVLPAGKTERGTYGTRSAIAGRTLAVISFPIPLAKAPTGATYVTVEEQQFGQVPAACIVEGVEGTVANPLANPGHLCVFAADELGLEGHSGFSSPNVLEGGNGAGTTGTVVGFEATGPNQEVFGAWAVTAAE